MASPFLAEIKIISFSFAAKGWALCNGQLLPINQNQALYSLIGTMYGGNGQTTFALPDLRGRAATDAGGGLTQGSAGGEVGHTLSVSELPAHNHSLQASSSDATTNAPSTNSLATSTSNIYCESMGNVTTLAPASVSNVGGSQAHENMQPSLVLNFMIALQGLFPPRN